MRVQAPIHFCGTQLRLMPAITALNLRDIQLLVPLIPSLLTPCTLRRIFIPFTMFMTQHTLRDPSQAAKSSTTLPIIQLMDKMAKSSIETPCILIKVLEEYVQFVLSNSGSASDSENYSHTCLFLSQPHRRSSTFNACKLRYGMILTILYRLLSLNVATKVGFNITDCPFILTLLS